MFVGDDWQGNERWIGTEESMQKIGVRVMYLPYTPRISSTVLQAKQEDAIDE